MSISTETVTTPTPIVLTRRRQAILTLVGILVLSGTIGLLWWMLEGRFHVSTDDAYVAGDIVQVTPQLAGTVLSVQAEDTDVVKLGAPLVELDPADSLVALDQAKAALGQVVREVRTLYAASASFGAIVTQRERDLAKVQDDLKRRQALVGTGAVSNEEIEHAIASVKAAEASLVAAREQLLANNALSDHTTVENHPNVLRAAARVEEVYLALRRTSITAPVAGQVAKRNVQIGTRVAPGQALMAIVPLDRVWVDANFKEVQLRKIRIGQPVTMIADIYGSQVPYTGRVIGFGAGTGSVFSLLPAQNATGNWIKIVQRVPVRITIEPSQIAQHPLRLGLSIEANVDIHDQSGPPLSPAEQRERVPHVAVAGEAPDASRQLIRSIITGNLGSTETLRSPAAFRSIPSH